jgi:hypothetical protein
MHSRLRCIRTGRSSGFDSRGKPGRYRINRGATGFGCSLDSRGKPGRYRINWVATEFGCSERVDPAISVMADFVGFAR